jgi:hypothetical protein
MLIVDPGHAFTYSFPAASTTGCIAVEPEAVMLPGTQFTAAADGPLDAAEDAPDDAAADGFVLAGATLGAVEAAIEGAVLAPLLVQAVAAMLASRTSAPRRFGVEMLT